MKTPPTTGDPWIDAYLKLRHAWCDDATSDDLMDYAKELRRGLPSPTPPPGGPAEIFIRMDISISGITPELVSRLWTPADGR